MRDIPHAHLEASLVLAEPMRHNPAARRPAETAQPTYYQHKCEYDGGVHRGVGPERDKACQDHREGRKDKADAEEFPGVRSVGDASHNEFREGVRYGDSRHREAGLARVDDPVVDHIRSGQRQVLAYKIVSGISEKRTQKDLGAHCLIGFVHLVLCERFTRLWRIKKT